MLLRAVAVEMKCLVMFIGISGVYGVSVAGSSNAFSHLDIPLSVSPVE